MICGTTSQLNWELPAQKYQEIGVCLKSILVLFFKMHYLRFCAEAFCISRPLGDACAYSFFINLVRAGTEGMGEGNGVLVISAFIGLLQAAVGLSPAKPSF